MCNGVVLLEIEGNLLLRTRVDIHIRFFLLCTMEFFLLRWLLMRFSNVSGVFKCIEKMPERHFTFIITLIEAYTLKDAIPSKWISLSVFVHLFIGLGVIAYSFETIKCNASVRRLL